MIQKLKISTNLNGRNPPTMQCANDDLYQGTRGISLEKFLVRQGASNPVVQFLPNIPPIMVSG